MEREPEDPADPDVFELARDELDALRIGERPDASCVACGHTRFVVTNGVPEVSDARLRREAELLWQAQGGEKLTDESFDALFHVFRCQRCHHAETYFLPPIEPAIAISSSDILAGDLPTVEIISRSKRDAE